MISVFIDGSVRVDAVQARSSLSGLVMLKGFAQGGSDAGKEFNLFLFYGSHLLLFNFFLKIRIHHSLHALGLHFGRFLSWLWLLENFNGFVEIASFFKVTVILTFNFAQYLLCFRVQSWRGLILKIVLRYADELILHDDLYFYLFIIFINKFIFIFIFSF